MVAVYLINLIIRFGFRHDFFIRGFQCRVSDFQFGFLKVCLVAHCTFVGVGLLTIQRRIFLFVLHYLVKIRMLGISFIHVVLTQFLLKLQKLFDFIFFLSSSFFEAVFNGEFVSGPHHLILIFKHVSIPIVYNY